MKWPKDTAQRRHAKQRALERYGVILDRVDLRRIVELIQGGESRPVSIAKETHRVKGHRVHYLGRDFVVVYDNRRKNIVTFLTEEMIAGGAS